MTNPANIRALVLARDAGYEAANRELVRLMVLAHLEGHSWKAIAGAMGMTQEGLRKFRRRYNCAGSPGGSDG